VCIGFLFCIFCFPVAWLSILVNALFFCSSFAISGFARLVPIRWNFTVWSAIWWACHAAASRSTHLASWGCAGFGGFPMVVCLDLNGSSSRWHLLNSFKNVHPLRLVVPLTSVF
jgi:hypothetical protein